MISGSEVIDPCPISVAADMMVIVPSVAMLTHGFSACAGALGRREPRRRRGPSSAMANDRPAAPIIT